MTNNQIDEVINIALTFYKQQIDIECSSVDGKDIMLYVNRRVGAIEFASHLKELLDKNKTIH